MGAMVAELQRLLMRAMAVQLGRAETGGACDEEPGRRSPAAAGCTLNAAVRWIRMMLLAKMQGRASLFYQCTAVNNMPRLCLRGFDHVQGEWYAIADTNGDAGVGRRLFEQPLKQRAAEQQRAAAAADTASLLRSIEAEASFSLLTVRLAASEIALLKYSSCNRAGKTPACGAVISRFTSSAVDRSTSCSPACHSAVHCRWLAVPVTSCSGGQQGTAQGRCAFGTHRRRLWAARHHSCSC